ncbi:hypothetical protein LJ707_03320 [Mucilaginibacter sp. UR6-1]|uniref:hypothetical protein n=1 Tax=Mucilaginibacter sp. UR6-1 TaxID=1435643 RepID=UPI001E2B892F|nr:hypothetical protein [Mucilaginibacter sp. UR6-1]MCC8407944.1 hypothetical protein [Mucilaginibacter sp. UR6-1]
MVNKLYVYILLLLIAADTTELHQLFKLPILFEHFAEHKQRDKSVSLMEFLSMHYWGDDLNDNDNDRDMQLPFKKLDVHVTHVFFLPVVRSITIKNYIETLNKPYSLYRQGFIPDPALSALFRPPCA